MINTMHYDNFAEGAKYTVEMLFWSNVGKATLHALYFCDRHTTDCAYACSWVESVGAAEAEYAGHGGLTSRAKTDFLQRLLQVLTQILVP